MVRMDRIPIGEQADNIVRLPRAGEAPKSSVEEMSYEEAIAGDSEAGADEPTPSAPLPGSQAAELAEQGVRVAAGLFAAAASALADAVSATLPHDDELEGQGDSAARLAGATLGAVVTAAEAAASAAKQVADTIGPAMTWLLEPRFTKDASEMAAGAARVLDGQWKASQAEMVETAASFLGALVPQIVNGIADQVDLDALMARVDLDALAERIARKIADIDPE